VAEKSRAPLYLLGAGDLGMDAKKVESGLSKALECCRLWGAVLLVDEADVFLETRDSNSLKRNELVSSTCLASLHMLSDRVPGNQGSL
jgi:hypothetical protein